MHLCSPINQVNIITVSLLPYIHRRNKSKRMKEAVFWDFFFPFLSKMVYHRAFLYSVVYMYVQTYIQRHLSVSSGKGSRALPLTPTNSTLQKRLDGPKNEQTDAPPPRRCQEVRLFSFNPFCFCSCALWGQKPHHPRPPAPKTCAEVGPPRPPNVTCLMKDGRSSLRVEKKREAMSCVETEIWLKKIHRNP